MLKAQAVHSIFFSAFPSQPQFIPPETLPSGHQLCHWEAFPPTAQCFVLDQNGAHGTMASITSTAEVPQDPL